MQETKRSDLSVQRERAVLVKVSTGSAGDGREDPLAELRALSQAAGAIVVDALTQRLPRVVARTYLGSGKVEELAQRVLAHHADLIIFDNDLTPAQIRELEEATQCKVLDRSELILDIFAARARTHEARLQVELAQLQYTAPRLRGMWTHLEKIAGAGGATGVGAVGGIGTRGPGERQIEIDRRIVRERIAALSREIAEVDGRKLRAVRSRKECFTVSLVGYTNSGKSTLFNALTGAGQFVADQLFATLDTKTVRWRIDESLTVLLSDTVGFVRDLPHRLVASFRATLEEAVHADLLLHVIDGANDQALQQVRAVEEVLGELGCGDLPIIVLLNKVDVATDEGVLHDLETRLPLAQRISAQTGQGLDRLTETVRSTALANTVQVTLRVPIGDGRLTAEIDREAKVLARRYDEQAAELDVVIGRGQLSRLTGRHRELEVTPLHGEAAPAGSDHAG